MADRGQLSAVVVQLVGSLRCVRRVPVLAFLDWDSFVLTGQRSKIFGGVLSALGMGFSLSALFELGWMESTGKRRRASHRRDLPIHAEPAKRGLHRFHRRRDPLDELPEIIGAWRIDSGRVRALPIRRGAMAPRTIRGGIRRVL